MGKIAPEDCMPCLSNEAYLKKLKVRRRLVSIALCCVCLLLLLNMGQALWRLPWMRAPSVVIAIFVALLGGLLYWRARRQAAMGLRQPTPDGYLRLVAARLRLVPDRSLPLAYLSALTTACYGDFDRARASLAYLEANAKAPIHQAWLLHVQAVIAYFSLKDPSVGLGLAQQARLLLEGLGDSDGAKAAVLTFDGIAAVGQVLAGKATEAHLDTLRAIFQAPPLLDRLLAAWALAIAYRQRSNLAAAKEMTDFLKRTAPYCRPLLTGAGSAE